MEQYIYGNIGQKGYRYESSNPEFFGNPKHMEALSHMVNYDKFCPHGELAPDAHQCFWMVTSNLDVPGAPDRLFLQAAGGDAFRSSFYAHGYMSSPEDGDMYGPELLKLLRTRFGAFKQIMDAAELGTLPAVPLQTMPVMEDLTPAPVEKELLCNVLLALLQNRQVILRLPSEGRAAMDDSRAFLLTLYQRMPYALRRQAGFATGQSSQTVINPTNPLPMGIRLILMDADAKTDGIMPSTYLAYFDLAGRAPVQPMLREVNGNPCFYVALIDYLVDTPLEELERFFRYCQEFAAAEKKVSLNINEYLMLLESFRIGESDFTDDLIRVWAANLYSSKYSLQRKDQLYTDIARVLNWEKLKDCIVRGVPHFDKLQDLGVLVSADIMGADQTSVRDTNAARTLVMAENLLKKYPAGTQELLLHGLAQAFIGLGEGCYPCFRETQPAAATKLALEKVELDPRATNVPALVTVLKGMVYDAMKQKRAAVLARYQENLALQKSLGDAAIANCQYGNMDGLEMLYRQLRGHYLYDELLEGWNKSIAQKIVHLCKTRNPQTLEDYGNLLALFGRIRSLFEIHGGTFLEEQKSLLASSEGLWQKAVDLDRKVCADLPDLLATFDEITKAALSPALTVQLRQKHAEALVLDEVQILNAVSRLCAHAKDFGQQQLLAQCIKTVPGLLTVAADLPLEETKKRLTSIQKLADAGLCQDVVDFRPWNARLSAKGLLEKIRQVEAYNRSKPVLPQLDLSDPLVRGWIVKQFPTNMDVKFLLFQCCPAMRPGLLTDLAKNCRSITRRDLELLYVAGCSREALYGANTGNSPAWTAALEELFPQWPELPPPMTPPEPEEGPKGSGLILAESVLFGLSGIVPGAMMLIMGTSLMVPSILFTAVQAVIGGSCLGGGLMVGDKDQKRLLRWLAASSVPGILTSAAALVLTILG